MPSHCKCNNDYFLTYQFLLGDPRLKLQDLSRVFTVYFAIFSDASKFFIRSEDRLGGTYKKALYIEYTDDTFNTRKNRTEDEHHLGSLGPVIRGEVGDTIEVVFQNKVRSN